MCGCVCAALKPTNPPNPHHSTHTSHLTLRTYVRIQKQHLKTTLCMFSYPGTLTKHSTHTHTHTKKEKLVVYTHTRVVGRAHILPHVYPNKSALFFIHLISLLPYIKQLFLCVYPHRPSTCVCEAQMKNTHTHTKPQSSLFVYPLDSCSWILNHHTHSHSPLTHTHTLPSHV